MLLFMLQQIYLMGSLTMFLKILYKTVQYYVIFEVLRSLLVKMAVHTGTILTPIPHSGVSYITVCHIGVVGRNSVVGIATFYGLNGPRIES